MSATPTTPAHIQFHFDPLCPLAWRTALWARETRKVRPLDITWRLFSLEIVNRPAGGEADYVNGRGWKALRTLALVRRKYGNEGVEKVYIQLGNAQHGRKESIDDRSVVETAVQKAGFEPGLVAEALADESTAQDVIRDHEEAKERYHAFGVPTIALEGSNVGIYGPVIHSVPKGEEAAEMWDHIYWTLQTPNLFEIKRDRAAAPPFVPVSAEE
jgi:predicted DsbA family dithiol-disulfide isomerase